MFQTFIFTKMADQQKIFALRLNPGDDLKRSLVSFVSANNIQAGYVITAVGSLSTCNLRYAGQSEGVAIQERFEILSLSGTLCLQGLHLHIALADANGKTFGGHLLDGNIIYTTAEIVIGEANQLLFDRIPDSVTGYLELVVKSRNDQGS